jgi:hypothetical protein
MSAGERPAADRDAVGGDEGGRLHLVRGRVIDLPHMAPLPGRVPARSPRRRHWSRAADRSRHRWTVPSGEAAAVIDYFRWMPAQRPVGRRIGKHSPTQSDWRIASMAPGCSTSADRGHGLHKDGDPLPGDCIMIWGAQNPQLVIRICRGRPGRTQRRKRSPDASAPRHRTRWIADPSWDGMPPQLHHGACAYPTECHAGNAWAFPAWHDCPGCGLPLAVDQVREPNPPVR